VNLLRISASYVAIAVACANGGSPLRQAPAKMANLSNPLESNEQARRAGFKLYARECAACHGPNREGKGKAPPLNRAEVYQAPPGVLFWVLRNGSLHSGMPSFAHLPKLQRWQIITFLRGLEDRNHQQHGAPPNDSGIVPK
jgi:mono/diheme cytochrome c family protein